jgi:2-polyprenyl-3-methyl-5-hydroxy-6-metoxy-1,4-benzoquinol methylase
MNRRERRASLSRAALLLPPGMQAPLPPSSSIADVYATAMSHYRRREFVAAQRLCREILVRAPNHVGSLVLLGDMAQQDGRNKQAVKLLAQALTIDSGNVAAHDTIAIAYQALDRRDEAVAHFTQALMLGLGDAETLITHSPAVAAALQRLAGSEFGQLPLAELLGADGASHLAGEALLMALLQNRPVHDLALEQLLTAIRRGLLQCAAERDETVLTGAGLEFFCALAQQCFINEYVFALSDGERAQLQKVQARLAADAEATSLDLIAAASYLPLHQLPKARALLDRTSPDAVARLVTQQVREPLEEQADYDNIPILTSTDDTVSLQVRKQYEENPYPRWIDAPPIKPVPLVRFLFETLGTTPRSWTEATAPIDVLIAGCGTGSHSLDTARRFARTRVLAIDMSRTSLAYARRKTRAFGLTNIDYAQADILKLGEIDRRFDVIEAVGVLHHLADPAAAWRLLLSLLRPNGLMFVGLYSASARRPLAAARGFIAERGYRATADDIRACRQVLMTRNGLPPFRDFSSMSGCRDLLFNVMEHQFTISEIKAFLDANDLTFLGFSQLPKQVLAQFQRQFPDPPARRDLAAWHSFEELHLYTFANMYFFWVQKSAA